MKRRSLLLMILIVLLPIALLTWFGLRMARDEQSLVQQRYRALMEQRLQDVNRTIAQKFQETERRLQQITSVDNFALDELRTIVRREPQVTQLFVMAPDGQLMYPNPASQLNGTEQSFLRQAFRMFTDRDLQNAVALAESGSAEQQLSKMNRLPPSRSSRDSGDLPFSAQSRSSYDSMIAMNDAEPEVPNQTQQPTDPFNSTADSPLGGGMGGAGLGPPEGFEPGTLPIAAAGNDAFSPPGSMNPQVAIPPVDSRALEKADVASTESATAPSFAAPARSGTRQANERQADSASVQETPQRDGDSTEQEKSQPAEQTALPQMAAAKASEFVQATPQLPAASAMTESAAEESAMNQAAPQAVPRPVLADSNAFQQNGPASVQSAPYRESRGWFVWYWDRGMNLVYWQRRPSGHIVGAALERARWIADLISWLPESDMQERDPSGFDTTFRVITSSAEPVYNWGADNGLKEPPFCEVPLAGPLASWRLQCFVPMAQITAGGGRSAYLGFGSGLIAFALTLCGLTWILYRDYARDMREASQQVSFVNQVSHELKTPLTNIRMYAELLERDLEQVDQEHSAKPRRRLDIINAEAQRLSRLIGNVLTFARQKKKTLQISPNRLDPVALVNQIAERFSPSLEEKGIQLQLEGQSATPLNLDADFIEQILGNLISNVEKYAASGKSLTIRTTTSENDVTIDVIDAGPGIPEKFHSSVFEPFERLNNDLRASSGTGIGLSIARDLARIHNGDVTLEPSENGCWFRVRLSSM